MSKRRRTRPEASGGKRPRLLFLVSQCPARRFPAPWSAELQPNYYVVRDADGQQLAYIYYSNDPERRAAAKLLTNDEARRIAVKAPTTLLHLRRRRTVRVRLAGDVKDVAGHFHRHQDHLVTADLRGPHFHGLPTGHLVLYETGIGGGIASRAARHWWVTTRGRTLCDCQRDPTRKQCGNNRESFHHRGPPVAPGSF